MLAHKIIMDDMRKAWYEQVCIKILPRTDSSLCPIVCLHKLCVICDHSGT
jgi:hypothetical protein